MSTKTEQSTEHSTELSQEEKSLFRESVRKFLGREIAPHYDAWEKDEIWPREVWNKFGDGGFLFVRRNHQ